jgi:hypothetical protein
MSLLKFFNAILTVIFFIGLSACASRYEASTTPTIQIISPSILVTDNLANIEIKEIVSGRACAQDFLWIIKKGDSRYLEHLGTGRGNAVERSKSAAAANALRGQSGLTTDFLVQPIWEINEFGDFFRRDVCATVKGYRAVIKNFEQLNTNSKITTSNGALIISEKDVVKSDQESWVTSLWPFR